MVKRVRRIISGHCAIARICGDSDDNNNNNNNSNNASSTPATHTRQMSCEMYDEWRQSAKLRSSFEKYASMPELPVHEACADIRRVKKLDSNSNSSTIIQNLTLCLSDIAAANAFCSRVRALSRTPFDSSDVEHERKLEELWQLLQPGRERKGGRYSKDWNLIGFQQADPASDFRGGGILALDQLLYMASNRTEMARRMIVEPKDEVSRYPWACVGINLTNECLRLLTEHAFYKQLVGVPQESQVNTLNTCYCDMFEILHHAWIQENPDNVLAFPAVKKRVLQDIDRQLAATGSLTVPSPKEA